MRCAVRQAAPAWVPGFCKSCVTRLLCVKRRGDSRSPARKAHKAPPGNAAQSIGASGLGGNGIGNGLMPGGPVCCDTAYRKAPVANCRRRSVSARSGMMAALRQIPAGHSAARGVSGSAAWDAGTALYAMAIWGGRERAAVRPAHAPAPRSMRIATTRRSTLHPTGMARDHTLARHRRQRRKPITPLRPIFPSA